MTKNEVTQLKVEDRVKDTRDNVQAIVLGVNENVLRIKYDDALSSNYICTEVCDHLEVIK
jgi:hypothetical protein